jgi:hypothetical protein
VTSPIATGTLGKNTRERARDDQLRIVMTRIFGAAGVEGSNPFCSTIFFRTLRQIGPTAREGF